MTLRNAEQRDLAQINDLIAAAMATWQLPQRVKRLSLPLYRYNANDLEHLEVIVAETAANTIVGVAAIEAADESDCPRGLNAALLHGIYVDPFNHRKGIGTRLMRYMQVTAASKNFDGLLIKANPEATSFFEAQDFEMLPIGDPSRDYSYRYWKSF